MNRNATHISLTMTSFSMTNIIQFLCGFKDKDDFIDFMPKFYLEETMQFYTVAVECRVRGQDASYVDNPHKKRTAELTHPIIHKTSWS